MIIAIIVAGFIVIMIGTNFYLDLLWFRELKAEGVFWTQYLTQWGLRLVAWLLLFAFLFVNLLFTRRHLLSFPNIQLREQLIAHGLMHMFTPRRLTFYYFIFSALIAFLFSGYVSGHWMDVLRFFNGVPFNATDPIFNAEISLFVFNLPFYRLIYGFLMMMLVLTLVVVLAIHLFLHYPTSGQGRWMMPSGAAVIHVSVLLSGIFALKAWDYRLQQLELVLSDRGVVFGAGHTDLHANLPVLKVLLVLAALIALLFILNIFLRRPKILVYGVLTLVGVSLLGGWAYPAAIQSFTVEPSEFAMEKNYLEHNIEFTRRAFGLDKFTNRHFPATDELAWADLEENPGTINNVRLWDYRPLLRTFNQLQAIRLYYRFNDVDIDRYTVDGDYRQVMLSARELDKSELDPSAQTWVNMHLQYTHGFGVTMSPVNEASPQGQPNYFLGDIPPVSIADELDLDNPAIYFGELTDDYVIINTDTPEFHYATTGGESAFTTYEGDAGIPLQSMFRRLLFALKFADYRILVSGELSNESRILFDRDIHTRVQKVAPFLRYDRDPYIVVSDGRLFWIQDAYTVTDRYPYSTQYGSINYIRNSVKVVVDAYNGTVDFYIVDPDDPLVLTYSAIFPGLFKDMSEMPEGLVKHLRYPEDLFNVQSQVVQLYHVTDPNVFYTREDLWEVAVEKYEGQEQPMEPYYTILQLPGYPEEEFVLILPFTPANRNNMIGWMVARCDQPNYGEVELFLFPRERVILGPRQVENRIDQDTVISEQLTLWDQAGSRVIRGNLLVLPINDSVIYVEPVFLEAEGGGLPELARVIIVHEDTVVMERTLENALVRLFGERGELPPDVDPVEPVDPEIPDPTPVDPGDAETVASLARRAERVFNEAVQLQRQGDWAGYGEKIRELGQILSELTRLVN